MNNDENPGNRRPANPQRTDRNREGRSRANRRPPSQPRRLIFNLAPGVLFYPSCGQDSEVPIKLFLDAVTEYHFVDHYIITPLPLSVRGDRRIINGTDYAIERTLHSEPNEEQQDQRVRFINGPANEEKRFHETWSFTSGENKHQVEMFRHHADNLEVFKQLDKIAVFFYRGDSPGEGGSGQMWMGTELFPLVVEKLAAKAIIATDGNNYSESQLRVELPWQAMLNNYPKDKDRDFFYQNRQFLYIGSIAGPQRDTGIWLVV